MLFKNLRRAQPLSTLRAATASADRAQIGRSPWQILGCGLIGVWAAAGAIATGVDLGTVQWMERQAQVLSFRLRGAVEPPANVVILAIDQESLARGADFQANPDRYPELAPLEVWPWRRAAYAQAIARLLDSGARTVAVDLVLTDPSLYSPADDRQLAEALRRHPGRAVLAANYEVFGTPDGGEQSQIVMPNPDFGAATEQIGLINFLRDADKRVYQLSDNLIAEVLQPQGMGEGLDSFAVATLRAAQLPVPTVTTGNIFYYGPPTTFRRVPFWHVLDPTNWAFHQRQGTFQDAIVLIGPLSNDVGNDFIPTPFSETMPGVEIHANAIATLMQDRVIHEALPTAERRGWFVLALVGGGGLALMVLIRRPVMQMSLAVGAIALWGTIGYLSFTAGQLIWPVAVPCLGLFLSGATCLTTGTISTQLERRRLRNTLERYVAAPIVQEILMHHSSDFQSLLKGRRVKAAVMFCDIRSFTTLSLELEPEALLEQLNEYLNAMVEAILAAGGTIDKFIGDAIMAEFGSPISHGAETDALNAIRAALAMRRSLSALQAQWQQAGKPILFNGVGINFGEAIAGDIGSVRRREFALIGDAVNIASRVEALTRNFWTDILITDSLYALVQDQVEVVPIGAQELKGRKDEKVMLYSLVGLKGEDSTLYHAVHERLRAFRGFEEMRG
jgi:adenylate cyclase